jgi:dephospho-CoA kinase
MSDSKLVIGLTGGIGAGKSTFAKILISRGYPVYDSDLRAKKLMVESLLIKNHLEREFGKESYIDGQLNRGYLASIVFDEPKKLAVLNAIVHPVVAADFEDWVNAQRSDVVFKEAAILFESGAYKHCHLNVNIYTDIDQRLQRIIKRDASSEEEVLKRINNQWPDEKRIELADFNYRNNDEDDLNDAVDDLFKKIEEHKN